MQKLPFGRTGHISSRRHLRRRRARRHAPGEGRSSCSSCCSSTASTTSTPPPSYGDSELRVGAVDAATTASGFFLATQDRRAHRATGARGELRALARAARRRPGRPDPAAQPGRRATSGQTALGPGGALEALVEARDAGPGALHRRHRPRHARRRDAPPQPRALPVRLGAAAVQLHDDARRRTTRADFEALLARVRGARRRGADDQVGRPPALAARTTRAPLQLVRAAARPRRASAAPCTSCSAGPGCSSTRRATRRCCRGARSRPRAPGPRATAARARGRRGAASPSSRSSCAASPTRSSCRARRVRHTRCAARGRRPAVLSLAPSCVRWRTLVSAVLRDADPAASGVPSGRSALDSGPPAACHGPGGAARRALAAGTARRLAKRPRQLSGSEPARRRPPANEGASERSPVELERPLPPPPAPHASPSST